MNLVREARHIPAEAGRSLPLARVSQAGKFFRLEGRKWYLKGFSYGPFSPNEHGENLPERKRMLADFAHIRALGANCLRVYYPPSLRFLDDALDHDLRVFVDVPWEKHRCFFEDWDAQQRAMDRVRETARALGNHPGLFAISVGNEIPADIVRFYGQRRVARFVDRLIDVVKQESPDCLTTYVNFPTTEFLTPSACDFYCFNVYIHDEEKLASYLDRLQHLAGNRPLILGEYGIDTIREGENAQAEMLGKHVRRIFRHGLAGSFIFAYTDDWFTGGHQIEDWAFGVTRVDRSEKLSAQELREVWAQMPHDGTEKETLPRVSVVVCTYNGEATLRACLESLRRVDYPNLEFILVDDGSTDGTEGIAQAFPEVIYHGQPNQGLSVARNTGAKLATGEIVVYTDDDCEVDEDWLRYLVRSMHDQGVEAIGGPNITPESDGWVAKCVAVSPGNPSHVMLNDQHAEHVPGCNMAFRRETLLGLGGFDDQFRQAGDDVDICWRFMDAGYKIGYAPGAMVWHHRRATVRAYIGQQKGYGRSEAMVHFKHPRRFGPNGPSIWRGIIYGDGAAGLPLKRDLVYHGRFGSGLFQTIYRHNHYGAWSCLMSLEWHLLAVFILFMASVFAPLLWLSVAMWTATLIIGIRVSSRAPLPRAAPWWSRPLVAFMYILQPILRGWCRLTHALGQMKLPDGVGDKSLTSGRSKRISKNTRDLYWKSEENIGREALLTHLVEEARQSGLRGDFDNAWADWDIKLIGDRWHDLTIRTATEELGWPKRFTRARCQARRNYFGNTAFAAAAVWTLVAAASMATWAIVLGLVTCIAMAIRVHQSRRRCLRAVTALVERAGEKSGLKPVMAGVKRAGEPASSVEPVERPRQRRRADDDSTLIAR